MAKGILIVDDAAFMRMVIKNILVKEGYEVVGEAADGKEAVALYNDLKPALVLLDITMPEMDGIEALKKIIAADPQAKVVMCSALGQSSMVIEAIQAGARDYIVKPFQPDRVLEAVSKCIINGRTGGTYAGFAEASQGLSLSGRCGTAYLAGIRRKPEGQPEGKMHPSGRRCRGRRID